MDASSPAAKPPSRKVEQYYLILDMNGLLMDKGNLSTKPHLRKYKFRRGVGMFFKFILEIGLVVTLWTCANKENAEFMFIQLKKHVQCEAGISIEALHVFDQSLCEEAYGNPRGERLRIRSNTKPYFFKSLAVLFFYNKIPGASSKNTLLIDDSPIKNLLNCPYNAIHPPPFNQAKEARIDDPYLTHKLIPYLIGLYNSEMSVPDYCMENPLEFGQNQALRSDYPKGFWGKLLAKPWHATLNFWPWEGCDEEEKIRVGFQRDKLHTEFIALPGVAET